MPIPTRPTRSHIGEWINYIGKVIVELLRNSNFSYLAKLSNDQIVYGFGEELLTFPNVYVFPVLEPGGTPTISGDIAHINTQYMIIVEGMSPYLLSEEDDVLRNILGDIIAVLLKNRTLTFNGNPEVRDTKLESIDVEFIPPNEQSADIRRWVMMLIRCEKKLDQADVTT